MDNARFDELKAKAAGEGGLDRDEADELGRLYAAEAGEPYANADDVKDSDELTNESGEGERLRQAEESGSLEDRRRPAPTDRPASPASLGEQEAEEGLQHNPKPGS